jgi:hypothetical protein
MAKRGEILYLVTLTLLSSSIQACSQSPQSVIATRLTNSIPVVVEFILTGVIGAGLGFLWNLLLKRRELDLAAAKGFHDLYGELFSTWKQWNYYVRDVGPAAFPDASRWKLLEKACAAEGRLESIFVEITSKRPLPKDTIEDLGRFRQHYQQLREVIKRNQPLAWDWSEHPEYMSFKKLAPRIGQLIRTGSTTTRVTERGATWLDVTSNKFEDFWIDKQKI